MTAKVELLTKVAKHKGQIVAGGFTRYLLGCITEDEFKTMIKTNEHHFESLTKELNHVSDDCIQSVMIALDRI